MRDSLNSGMIDISIDAQHPSLPAESVQHALGRIAAQAFSAGDRKPGRSNVFESTLYSYRLPRIETAEVSVGLESALAWIQSLPSLTALSSQGISLGYS